MDTGLKPDIRQSISDKLSSLLADTYLVYIQTQNCHWNLVGKDFYEIHILLDKQYHELVDVLDEMAERIRGLGFYVDASFQAFRETCKFKEILQVMSSYEALELLLTNQESVIRNARQVGTFADSHADHGTVDFIGRFIGLIEKYAWMIRSQLSK